VTSSQLNDAVAQRHEQLQARQERQSQQEEAVSAAAGDSSSC
jgi:hypothetical protein